jgi:hypothetical protein
VEKVFDITVTTGDRGNDIADPLVT